jgi:hypothetical protein
MNPLLWRIIGLVILLWCSNSVSWRALYNKHRVESLIPSFMTFLYTTKQKTFHYSVEAEGYVFKFSLSQQVKVIKTSQWRSCVRLAQKFSFSETVCPSSGNNVIVPDGYRTCVWNIGLSCDFTQLLTSEVCHWIWVYVCNQKIMWIIFILCHNAVSDLYVHENPLYRYPSSEYSFWKNR